MKLALADDPKAKKVADRDEQFFQGGAKLLLRFAVCG